MSSPEFSLRETAVAMHELFMSYLAAGFTEQQALYLIGQMMVRSNTPEGK